MIHLQNYARKLRGHIVPVILVTMIPPLSARSDDIPTLDVRPVCRTADPLAAGLKAAFEECVKSEQGVREQLKQAWPTFSEADKKHCIALAKTGGEASNTELLMHNAPAAVVELRRKQPLMRPSGLARLATTKESFQLLDANTNSQSTRNGEPKI